MTRARAHPPAAWREAEGGRRTILAYTTSPAAVKCKFRRAGIATRRTRADLAVPRLHGT